LKTTKAEFRKIFLEIIVICIIASGIGLYYNFRNPEGLPFIYKETVVNKTSDEDLFGKTSKQLMNNNSEDSKSGKDDIKTNEITVTVDSISTLTDIAEVQTEEIKIPEKTMETMEEPVKSEPTSDVTQKTENIEHKNDEPEIDDEGNIIAEYTDVTYDQVLRMIDNPDFVLVDARREETWAEGHIGNAVNIFPYDPNEVVFEKCFNLPPDKKIVVYCEGGDCDSSHLLVEILLNQVLLENVYIYTGGWEDWISHQ
jgi:rhodanese-related sulfurtransferase